MKARRPIARMTWDSFSRSGWRVNAVPHPKWNDVRAAIDRLDGQKRTVVQLEASTPGITMEVMKSGSDYVVTHQQEMGSGVTLATLKWTEPPAAITCRWGEREYVFPVRCRVPKDMAVAAVRQFFDTGQQGAEHYWEAVTPEVVSRVPRP
jgi:immunity protein Imm1 of predicted polymorphic toxin system